MGVPALNYGESLDFKGKPAGWGAKKRAEYEDRDYHKPSDEIKADWDLSGGVEDLRLLYDVGRRVADGSVWPAWKPGREFKAVREAQLK